MISYNKLIRDNIPQIINKSGKIVHYHMLNNADYINELDKKLNEECAEYQADKSLEELADIVEVVYAIAEAKGYKLNEFEQIRQSKAEERGSFKYKLFLDCVSQAEDMDSIEYSQNIRNMLSQTDFVRMVNVQSETIDRYLREEKIKPDYIIQINSKKVLRYFNKSTIIQYAENFGWTVINEDNRLSIFWDMVSKMTMSYSYKPVLLKAMLQHCNNNGRADINDIVSYFRRFYTRRKNSKLIPEKSNSIFASIDYSDEDIKRLILRNPYKRFADMQVMDYISPFGILEFDCAIWESLSSFDKDRIVNICDKKLQEYYEKL